MVGTPAGTTCSVARCVLIPIAPCVSNTATEQVAFGTMLVTGLLADFAVHTQPAASATSRRNQLRLCGNACGARLYVGRSG